MTPYSTLVRQQVLPYQIFNNEENLKLKRQFDFQKYKNPNDSRRRMNLSFSSFEELAKNKIEHKKAKEEGGQIKNVYTPGQSKRIFGELHKVIDSSDVVLIVVDSRNPLETNCKKIFNYLRKEKQHKNIVYVLNKADLVPKSNLKQWLRYFSQYAPVITFCANLDSRFGVHSLITLLKQY